MDAFGTGTNRILTARRSGDLVGVVFLQRRMGVMRSASNWHSPEFGVVAVDDDVVRALVEKMLAARARRCSLAFANRDEEPAGSWESMTRSARHRSLARVLERSPFVDTTRDWRAYEATLSKKLRSELRRRRRKLEEQGVVRLEVSDGSNGLEDDLDEGFRIEAAAWKGSRGSAINSDDATRRFYICVARWASERGWLRLAFLQRDRERLAFDLCFETDDVHYLLKTGYEPAYRKLAPGMLMRYEMLKRAFERGLRSYEFLGSDNPWKLEWTDATRDRMLLQAFPASLQGRIEWLAFAHGRPLVKKALTRIDRKNS